MRAEIAERLYRDLIGPDDDNEALTARPSDVYLTGIIWPERTQLGGEDDDRITTGEDAEGGEEGTDTGAVSAARTFRPSVAGISFAISGNPASIDVDVAFGHYIFDEDENRADVWRRQFVKKTLHDIPCDGNTVSQPVSPDIEGVFIHVRSVRGPEKGTWIVTASLMNRAAVSGRRKLEEHTLFQTAIKIRASEGSKLIPRPSRLAIVDDDDRSNDLLYRNSNEFAVGHTCGADWRTDEAGKALEISATWLPSATVAQVSADGHVVFDKLRSGTSLPLDARWLSEADDADLASALARIPAAYVEWIDVQRDRLESLSEERRETANEHIRICESVAARMRDGVAAIGRDSRLAISFRLANAAMNLQYRWAQLRNDVRGDEVESLLWRPFQLAFILLSAVSSVEPDHPERRVMDLLWFPTGGGKTEAYLGLIAFLAFARRLLHGDAGGGVSVIMRYTLRLLTTQQFSRAAAMMLACEAIRRRRVQVRDSDAPLGTHPFAIGLWIGGEATPNTVAEACLSLDNDSSPSPKQLDLCPACGESLIWTCRRVERKPRSIEVRCPKPGCTLHDANSPLPVWSVDEDVYRERPTLLIGTVDKFAQIARRREVGTLFNAGGPHPPDLIIQDELHLISGPLGTLVALYECAVDRLFSRDDLPPKVIGSTATIRRAGQQVGHLFDRDTCQFPPPGIDADDSGFAVVDTDRVGRQFIGVTTAGRSAKFTLQAVFASLLQAASDPGYDDDQRDPYWTLVGYFNALRELGGSLVLMQDDVPRSIELLAQRHDEAPREIGPASEMTSRLTQRQVIEMLEDMGERVTSGHALDSVLATNMISVGVDVPRLGLMVVNGQPKGIAEYIQATSRVGRQKPGLVVAVLNNAKARDRSHFETFRTWHSTLYRDVESTSVTPFSPRARDRALHAPLAALARHMVGRLRDGPADAVAVEDEIKALVRIISERARRIDPDEKTVEQELERFLQEWKARSPKHWWQDSTGDALMMSAERAAVLGRSPGRGLPRSTPNSMRNVEPGVPFRLAERLSRR